MHHLRVLGGAAVTPPGRGTGRAVTPVFVALRETLRRFVARRVPADQVEDVVQDILLRMHERADDLRDEARLAAWAFRIAQHAVADHYRSRQVASTPADAADLAAASEDAPNVNEIVAGWLRPMLTLLPTEYAEALERVDVEGMTQTAFAERAGLSVSGAKTRVQRGRRMLEQLVRACCDLELDARGNVIAYRRRWCRD